MTTFPIFTNRLTLRHLGMEDVKRLHQAIFGDPDVMFFGDGTHAEEWVYRWLQNNMEHYQLLGFGAYAIAERHQQALIGYCGLFHFPDVNGKPEVEIGYRLARSAWGHGYATEAARAIANYAFTTVRLRRLIAIIDPENTASIRVAEKLGMQYEQDIMFEGYSHPDHVYALSHQDE